MVVLWKMSEMIVCALTNKKSCFVFTARLSDALLHCCSANHARLQRPKLAALKENSDERSTSALLSGLYNIMRL